MTNKLIPYEKNILTISKRTKCAKEVIYKKKRNNYN